MEVSKLEKNVKLYKNQFESLLLEMYGYHRLDRASIDTDAILFRIKYMLKHNLDLDKLPALRDEFCKMVLEVRKIFDEFAWIFIDRIVGIPKSYRGDDIINIMIEDVKMDSVYVSFKMNIVSAQERMLVMIDNKFDDDVPYNMFPDKFFRVYTDSYNDGIAKAYPELFESRYQDKIGTGSDRDVYVHNFTFQTSERCSLNCTYCYQFNKSPMRMEFDTAKKFIDELLADHYGYINRYNSPAIIIEFIGGEPLLEINLTRKIYEYFLDQCYKLDHPWFTMHRLSICSNGLQYFDDEVQDFFKEYAHNISFNISIDGNKELHDSCRIQPNGEGSYDIDMMALNHFNEHYAPERNSKMTLAPQNISYLYDSVVDFISKGMYSINLNCVFEEGWNQDTARTEYDQLKKLADYLIDNDLDHLYVSIFSEQQEDRQSYTSDGVFCGGTGAMLALRPNGQFYPCIRYMPSSVGDNVADLCIGTVDTGLVGRTEDSEILKMMDRITRRSLSNDICYDCPIGNDCAYCSALSHTVNGTPNKRTMFTCIQMIAEALANVYYWNRLNLKHPEYNLGVRKNNVPVEWMKLVIDDAERDELSYLEVMSMISTLEHRSE